jgi:hypothetical protein
MPGGVGIFQGIILDIGIAVEGLGVRRSPRDVGLLPRLAAELESEALRAFLRNAGKKLMLVEVHREWFERNAIH